MALNDETVKAEHELHLVNRLSESRSPYVSFSLCFLHLKAIAADSSNLIGSGAYGQSSGMASMGR